MRFLREKIGRLMIGRYGIDRLYYLLMAVCFILIIVSLFVPAPYYFVVSTLETLLFCYAFFRVMSRNIYKRQQENLKFIKLISKPKDFFKLQKCKKRDKKTHVYKRCPECKNNLRLPRQKGKHTVVCPCCKHRFEVKI